MLGLEQIPKEWVNITNLNEFASKIKNYIFLLNLFLRNE